MSYLDRLKQLESGEIFHHTPKHEPTEPTKGPSDGFVGSIPGAYENIHAENDADETGNKDDSIFQKVTRPLPTEPSEAIDDAHWCWWLAFSEAEHLITYHHPPATRAEVLAKYPRAVVAEPFEPATAPQAAGFSDPWAKEKQA